LSRPSARRTGKAKPPKRPAALPRRYFSPQRSEQVNATRRHILTAAQQLFGHDGFAAVTMPRIAEHAGVSLATIYLYFPGKAAIVGALAEEIVAAPDLSVEQVEHEVDQVRQLQHGAAIVRHLNERSWLVAEILRGARATDENLKEIWDLWQQRHIESTRRVVEALHANGGLRPGLEVDEAVDVLYALAGTDVYRALVRERGWSPARYEQWLFGLGCQLLLEPTAGEGQVIQDER
jgi:AcrR family transcriptional regulator